MSILVAARVVNLCDTYRKRREPAFEVRSVEVDSAIVDPSLDKLWLPPSLVEELGLVDVPTVPLERTRWIPSENGSIVHLYVGTGFCTFAAFQSSDAYTVVIGSIALLALGLEVDETTGSVYEVPGDCFAIGRQTDLSI